MDWKEKILEGMKLIKEGCKENTSWTQCCHCPFNDWCTIFEFNNREHKEFFVPLPSDWFEESD